MRQYANAKIYGQPPSTDGAYARLHGYVFLTNDDKINHVVLGENQDVPEDMGTLIVSYRLPISKTVDENGKTLEGDPTILDVLLSVTKDNFRDLREDNLRRAIVF